MRPARLLLPAAGLVAAALLAGAAVPSGATARGPRLAVARLQYEGDDWYANPSSLPNLIAAIRERTTLAVEPREIRTTLADERLWDYPF
ncbi:MAG: DUF4159 domain-containing protein, partial [Gemmatimonadaceae bacterium]|nr:DUF4159 domain-containing protein [Gemmatimonadaceae bacterium]